MKSMAIACALLASCAAYEDRVQDVGTALPPSDVRTIHGDTSFSPWERVAAEQACVSWQQFTRGRVHLSIRWDLDDSNYMDLPGPILYRVQARHDYTGGWTEGDRIWFVPSVCTDLQACMMHEIGHMLGLCPWSPERDTHLPPGNVMTAHNPPHQFGAADFAECVRVGVCRPRNQDVTTVTLTIDPAVPNVEPNYP